MSNLRTTSGDAPIVVLHSTGETVVTVTLRWSRDAITSGWHATKRANDGHMTLLLSLDLLLNAETYEEARDEVEQLARSLVLPLVANNRARPHTSALSKPPSKNLLLRLAETHVLAHRELVDERGAQRGVIESTAREYSLATQFGVTAPAPLLAQLDGTSTKTIHQRLFVAREQHLLESFGKGRTTPTEEDRE